MPHSLSALILAFLLLGHEAALCAADKSTEFPNRRLRLGDTELTVVMPDAQHGYYRGPRFDWGGMVTQATWRGHTFFTELKTPHEPSQHDHASGACEEFGLDAVDGYQTTPVGGQFMKIGVGALTRVNDKPYFFGNQYPIARPAEWEVKQGPDALTFNQEFTLDSDRAYAYEKTVIVLADGFRISRRLTNHGAQRLVTNHYCHNMIAIDGMPIDGSWSLLFDWDVVAKTPAPSFVMSGRMLTLTTSLTSTLWVPFTWDTLPTTTSFTLTHQTSGITLAISIDAPPSAFHLYGEPRALCPEPFVAIDLAPGAMMSWSSTYRFSQIAK